MSIFPPMSRATINALRTGNLSVFPKHSLIAKWGIAVLNALILSASPATLLANHDTRESCPVASSSRDFPAPSANFDDHVAQVYCHIRARSLPGRTEEDVHTNLPFEMDARSSKPYRGKFLLIHGLNDSAYVWRDIARELSDRGFDVRAILLPGHGSHPSEMLDISYQHWLSAARHHLAVWDNDETPIYLGGFSMGAVIATLLALENTDISGLFLVSPAYRSKLNHVLRWSWAYQKFRPWMFGGMILEDNPMKYNSIPINSGTQYYRLTRNLWNQWGDDTLSMPVLMVMTANDSVVDIDYSRGIFEKRFTSPSKSLLLYSGDRKIRARNGETIRDSAYPEKRILNQSHLSMINDQDNPLLGENGAVLICNGNKFPVFFACMTATDHWYGAQHTPSPDGIAVARTTYNPDFDSVLGKFDRVFLSPD